MFNAMILALVFSSQLPGSEPVKAQAPTVELVLAKDHVPGSFLTSETVYANRKHVYLASYEGRLFVLDNTKADFPVIATIQVSALPLRSVRGDRTSIYVTSNDGKLYVFENKKPFRLIATRSFSSIGLISLVVDEGPKGSILMSEGQTEMTADSSRVYLSALNDNENVVSADKQTYAVEETFGEPFEYAVTVAFDRYTRERIGSVPNPPDVLGTTGQVALYVNGDMLVQTIPGCCGTGVFLYNSELQPTGSIPLSNANTVAVMNGGKWLVVGTESGMAAVFDISLTTPTMLASIDLRQVTGHTGSEDIEIRSLWADPKSGLVYAGSSWGNAISKSLTLPSFFVLRIK